METFGVHHWDSPGQLVLSYKIIINLHFTFLVYTISKMVFLIILMDLWKWGKNSMQLVFEKWKTKTPRRKTRGLFSCDWEENAAYTMQYFSSVFYFRFYTKLDLMSGRKDSVFLCFVGCNVIVFPVSGKVKSALFSLLPFSLRNATH